MAANNVPVTLDTPIAIKVLFRGQTKKVKLPLKDLGANSLPEKLKSSLQIQTDEQVIFERWSDSAAAYVTLESDKPQVYKTLFRAAKAKLKLRIKATFPSDQPTELPMPSAATEPVSSPLPSLHRLSAETLTPYVVAPISPIIAHSPETYHSAPKFEAVSPVSLCKLVDHNTSEAPVPQSFTARQSFCSNMANPVHKTGLAFRPKPNNACTSWVVYCNNCNNPIEDEHLHCSICDGGDYDLCPGCVESGAHCPESGHWMVKRFVKNGCALNSTTQRIAPKVKVEEPRQEIPGAFTDEKQPVIYEQVPSRTCNSCVKILHESEFVHCTDCEDYDLCLKCHISNKHGHHPGHIFKPATNETVLPTLASFLCNSGRNVRHSAVCDGCDKFIFGVRHKCLNCPDWDYCSECVKNAKFVHARHRFVPIYEPLAESVNSANRHYGIYCDGPLCKDKENMSYIEGIRYKCAVCHNTDFCQNCEAHPTNKHNHTHPLIKFKTPVRSVSVTTVNEDSCSSTTLGDRRPTRRSTATETTPVAPSANAATPVHTIVDVKPIEESIGKKEKIAIQNLLSPVEPVEKPKISISELTAEFTTETCPDGTGITANAVFTQTWTLRNPGPITWPKGCRLSYIGGDNMLHLDNSRIVSSDELSAASESNIVNREVKPGETIPFTVTLKAPSKLGCAISYWRLKTPQGLPFGHRLWCDINVSPALAPVVVQQTPKPVIPGVSAMPKSHASLMRERLIQAKHERTRTATQQRQIQMMQLQNQAIAQQQQQFMLEMQLDSLRHYRQATAEKLLETHRQGLEVAHQDKPIPVVSVPEDSKVEPTVELPVEEKAVEASASAMVFPQLDKESPSSSTYEVANTQPLMSLKSETVASEREFFEDAESIAFSDDDGFATDDQWDILDASDEEN